MFKVWSTCLWEYVQVYVYELCLKNMFKVWTYFTPCSSVSIVNFELVNAGWEVEIKEAKAKP